MKIKFIAETLLSGNVMTYFLHNHELAEFTAPWTCCRYLPELNFCSESVHLKIPRQKRDSSPFFWVNLGLPCKMQNSANTLKVRKQGWKDFKMDFFLTNEWCILMHHKHGTFTSPAFQGNMFCFQFTSQLLTVILFSITATCSVTTESLNHMRRVQQILFVPPKFLPCVEASFFLLLIFVMCLILVIFPTHLRPASFPRHWQVLRPYKE